MLDERWERGGPDAAAHRIAVFCHGYGWQDLPQVVDAVTAQVWAAREDHAHLDKARAVEHFTRLLGWLTERGERLSGRARVAPC